MAKFRLCDEKWTNCVCAMKNGKNSVRTMKNVQKMVNCTKNYIRKIGWRSLIRTNSICLRKTERSILEQREEQREPDCATIL